MKDENKSFVYSNERLSENESRVDDGGNVLFHKTIFDNAIQLGVVSKFYKATPNGVSMTRHSISYGGGICERKSADNVINEEPVSIKAIFTNLPTNVMLQIFSYLDVYSLCKVSSVCRRWYALGSDSLLWEVKLTQDVTKWEVIDHLSHPSLHQEINPELTAKDIYVRCCPECKYLRRNTIQFPTHLPSLSYFFGFSIPQIVMFGSGLDSSGLVRRVFWDETSPFKVKGMFPGQFGGVGSGVTLEYSSGKINMICMYALSRAERANQDVHEERRSRLLVGESREISRSVKELCSSVNAFIYIVDGTTQEAVTFGIEEFKAVIDDRWLQPKVPVLILCLVQNATIKSLSSIQVANELELLKLTRPWQVRQCHVNSLYGFTPGVNWLNKHIMGL